jgi:alpha-mannosidase
MRQRGEVTLRTGFKLSEARKTNLLEQTGESLNARGNSVTLYMRPFEIVTLRLIPG